MNVRIVESIGTINVGALYYGNTYLTTLDYVHNVSISASKEFAIVQLNPHLTIYNRTTVTHHKVNPDIKHLCAENFIVGVSYSEDHILVEHYNLQYNLVDRTLLLGNYFGHWISNVVYIDELNRVHIACELPDSLFADYYIDGDNFVESDYTGEQYPIGINELAVCFPCKV